MARKNQGPMIAIIILVLLLITAVVVAYLNVSKSNEYAEKIKGLETSIQREQTIREAYEIQAQIIKAYVGYEGSVSEANSNMSALSRFGR